MAGNVASAAQAAVGNRANAARNRAGVNQRPGAALQQLNPERAPPLIAKWQKLLGKDLDRIEVEYKADSVSVYLYGKVGTPYYKEDDESLSIPEYREMKALETKPSDDEALRAFRDKFELRLNRPFPAEGPSSGKEEDIRAFLERLDFHQRRAMLMSNKQFKAAYPNGFAQA
jgi:hypothetical protein